MSKSQHVNYRHVAQVYLFRDEVALVVFLVEMRLKQCFGGCFNVGKMGTARLFNRKKSGNVSGHVLLGLFQFCQHVMNHLGWIHRRIDSNECN